jgi:hypothetical protein
MRIITFNMKGWVLKYNYLDLFYNVAFNEAGIYMLVDYVDCFLEF